MTNKEQNFEEEIKQEQAEETAEEVVEETQEAPEDEKAAEEEESYKDQYVRLMAEFQNFKKRTEKEKSDIIAYANEKIVMDLLTVVDNFERAMEHDEKDGFKEGIKMIFDQLSDALKHAGVEEIEAENVVFDPNVHSAVMMEDTDAVESGNVSGVLQKGYKLNGKVIRPSMVKVAN